jgi:hypothetical protein
VHATEADSTVKVSGDNRAKPAPQQPLWQHPGATSGMGGPSLLQSIAT